MNLSWVSSKRGITLTFFSLLNIGGPKIRRAFALKVLVTDRMLFAGEVSVFSEVTTQFSTARSSCAAVPDAQNRRHIKHRWPLHRASQREAQQGHDVAGFLVVFVHPVFHGLFEFGGLERLAAPMNDVSR